MKHLLILFLFPCLLACRKEPDPYGTPPQPGTFNLTTVITDAAGKSVDIAGDWAVFTEPEETRFNKFIQFTQDSETVFDIQSNEAFMLEYKQDRETLPVYSGGKVDKRRSQFLPGGETKLIYIDGEIYLDFRDTYILYGAYYGAPFGFIILDEDTLGHKDRPGYRLRRIRAFAKAEDK